MMAMAKAPGTSWASPSTVGSTGPGNPLGTGVIRAIPCSSIDAKVTNRIPPTTATSGPGTCGRNRRSRNSIAMVPAENAVVVQLISPRFRMTARISEKKLSAPGSPGCPAGLAAGRPRQ